MVKVLATTQILRESLGKLTVGSPYQMDRDGSEGKSQMGKYLSIKKYEKKNKKNDTKNRKLNEIHMGKAVVIKLIC